MLTSLRFNFHDGMVIGTGQNLWANSFYLTFNTSIDSYYELLDASTDLTPYLTRRSIIFVVVTTLS